MLSKDYTAVVRPDGKLPEFTGKAIKGLLKKLAGKQIVLTIEEYIADGSSAQQKYYFKCIVTPIWQEFREAGNVYSKDGVHHWLMQHVGKWVEMVEGEPVLRSYMKLKKPEREEHHQICRIWAADTFGLQLNLPNEVPIEAYS